MNAAARLFNQGELSRAWVFSLFLNRFQWMWVLFAFGVISSALCLIYVTNSTRSLHASIQQEEALHDRLYVQWGQLLLEKSSLTTQTRVQTIAENKLAMRMPEGKSLIVINETRGTH